MAIAHFSDWSLASVFACRSPISALNSNTAAKFKFQFPFVLFLNQNSRAVRADSSVCSPPLLEEDAPVIELGSVLGEFEQAPAILQADYVELDCFICSLFGDSRTEDLGYEYYQRSRGKTDFSPQAKTLKFLIRYLIRSKNWSFMFSFCNDLKTLRFLPDKSACRDLMTACVKARKVKLVYSFLDVFMDNDLNIALVGFGSAMKGFNQLHMYSSTVDLYQKLTSFSSLDLSLPCSSLAMEAYFKMGQHEKVVAVFHEIKSTDLLLSGRVPSSSLSKVYLILCESLGKMGRTKEAVASFRDMLKKGISENHEFYSSLICSLARSGEVEMAEQLLQEGECKEMVRNPALFFQLVVRYVKEGMVDKTLDVVATMKRVNIRVSDCVLSAVVNGFCRKKGSRSAVEVYETLVSSGHEPGQVTYASVLNMYVHLGFYSKAESILADMENREFNKCVVAYSSMVAAYARQGRTSDAKRVVAQMKARGCDPNIWTYNCLLEMYGRALDFRQLEKTWIEMRRRNISPDRVGYTTMISAYNRVRDYGMCVKYFEDFKQTAEKVDAALAGVLVAVLSKTNRVDEVMELLQDLKMEKTTLDTRFYRSVMSALRDAGLEAQARWLERPSKNLEKY